MDFSGSVELPFSRETVWAGLNDTEVLRACIPGCESFDEPEAGHFDIVSVIKIGIIKARFSGTVELSDLDPPNGYKIFGKGTGGVAGYASGQALVRLEDNQDSTCLRYSAKADIGGKIAQLGSRVIDGAANQIAARFFKDFRDALVRKESGQPIVASNDLSSADKSNATSREFTSKQTVQKLTTSRDWLLPYGIGMSCGAAIGALGMMAFG